MANWPWLPMPGPFVMAGTIRNRLRFGGKAAKRECPMPETASHGIGRQFGIS